MSHLYAAVWLGLPLGLCLVPVVVTLLEWASEGLDL